MNDEIHPQRLVWIQMGNNCMFCPNPQGESYSTYVALYSKVGYISCNLCREKMNEAVEFWNTHHAYGKAKHLKDRTDLKIKRSNGAIEAGWGLDNPLINIEHDGQLTIHCYNKSQNIGKWCYLEDILEWNTF